MIIACEQAALSTNWLLSKSTTVPAWLNVKIVLSMNSNEKCVFILSEKNKLMKNNIRIFLIVKTFSLAYFVICRENPEDGFNKISIFKLIPVLLKLSPNTRHS